MEKKYLNNIETTGNPKFSTLKLVWFFILEIK